MSQGLKIGRETKIAQSKQRDPQLSPRPGRGLHRVPGREPLLTQAVSVHMRLPGSFLVTFLNIKEQPRSTKYMKGMPS